MKETVTMLNQQYVVPEGLPSRLGQVLMCWLPTMVLR